MAHTVKIDRFEGPLDLLLQLIEREELPITDVALAEVTDQYVEHIQHVTVPSEELADFLVIAAKLLYIKSRLLVPSAALAPEEGISLEEQLRMYKEFVEASKGIAARLAEQRFSFSRERAPLPMGVFTPPPGVQGETLRQIFSEIIGSLEPVVRLPQTALERVVSIEERIHYLRELLGEKKRISFGLYLRSAKTKTDVVVSFLALLELMKQRSIRVAQDDLFSDMTIELGERPISTLIEVTAL